MAIRTLIFLFFVLLSTAADADSRQGKGELVKVIPNMASVADIKAVSYDICGVVQMVSGHRAKVTLTHGPENVKPQVKQTDDSGKFCFEKGPQRICVQSPGAHELHFVHSCIFFGSSSVKFDTSNPSPVLSKGEKYLLKGQIHVERPTSLVSDGNDQTGAAVYEYSFWANFGDVLTFVPHHSRNTEGKKILFYPRERHVSVITNCCQATFAAFSGRLGLYIEGSVSPPISGVDIRIVAAGESSNVPLKKGGVALKTTTGADGVFVAGPLYDDIEYSTEASKPGYHLKRTGSNSFTCQKLSQISIRIYSGEETTELFPSVLLSLSGEDGYRNNSASGVGGFFLFDSLFPGSFYLRPLLKEYSFSPAARAIELGSGESKEVVFHATRVAYSAMGTVSLLSGQPMEGISVETRSESKGYYEETTTDSSGYYRLRGLLPDTSYSIKVVAKGDFESSRVERASPEFVEVKVDVSGTVLCKEKCGPFVMVSLIRSSGSRKEETKTVGLTQESGDFMFPKIFPGKYRLEVKYKPSADTNEDKWCWERSSIDVDVGTEDVNGIVFVQKGYWINVISSHDVDASIHQPDGSVLNLKIKKGPQRICVQSPGAHELHFVNSCIFFGSSSVKFDTSNPSVPVVIDHANADINFRFTGFTICGKVMGAVGGQSCSVKDGGPSDVKVELLSPNTDDVVSSTFTSASGSYMFTNIIPGTFKLRASHPNLKVEVRGSSEVELGFGNRKVDDIFFVPGYDIQGFVVAQGNPLLGVHMYLHSDDVLEVDCPQGPGNSPREKSSLCHAVSDADGKFTFNSIPCGTYELLPYYKGENTVFDVSPPSVLVPVQHRHVAVTQKFQVTLLYSGPPFTPAPGITTRCIFLNSSKAMTRWPEAQLALELGQTYQLVVHVQNGGRRPLLITSIFAAVHCPSVSENLTTRFYNETVEVSEERPVPFLFRIKDVVGKCIFRGMIIYDVDYKSHQNLFYDGTIDVHGGSDSSFGVIRLLLFLFLFFLVIFLCYCYCCQCNSNRKRKKEKVNDSLPLSRKAKKREARKNN